MCISMKLCKIHSMFLHQDRIPLIIRDITFWSLLFSYFKINWAFGEKKIMLNEEPQVSTSLNYSESWPGSQTIEQTNIHESSLVQTEHLDNITSSYFIAVIAAHISFTSINSTVRVLRRFRFKLIIYFQWHFCFDWD